MFILASGSPRRYELLKKAGQDFLVMPADIDESIIDGTSPEEAVKLLSKKKAEFIYKKCGIATLGADTVVVFEGKIIGKPKDDEDAVKILKTLSGKTHFVYTGVTLFTKRGVITFCVRSEVEFNELKDGLIKEYVASGLARDKAGAYGIQDGKIVKTYRGSYTNIVGLPMEETEAVLRENGLWQ